MDSIFETMEQSGIIDRLMFWTALFLPLFTAGLAFVLRNEDIVKSNRHRWVLMALAGPALLVLWHVYNRVVDHFGLDSVKGLLVNCAIFLIAALLFTGLRITLKALVTETPPPPSPAPITGAIPTQRFTTKRMRSLNPAMPPPPPPPVNTPAAGTSPVGDNHDA